MLAQAMQAAGPRSADDQLTASLLRLLRWLQSEGYRFTTVTPATHARVLAREPAAAATR
jgi:cobalamin biosynthesis Mg chelatase CobN